MLKLYLCETLLETVTVNGVPAFVGVALAGLTVQVAGAPLPQLSAAVLTYPFKAARLPLN